MEAMVLPPLFQVIFDRLASPVLKRFSDFWDLEDDSQSLRRMLLMVQAVLDDAEQRQVTDKVVRIWLSRLKDVVDEAEDLLDECVAAIHAAENMSRVLDSIVFDADKVKRMLQELTMVAQEGLNLNLRVGGVVDRLSVGRRESSSFVIESEVQGRKDDREKIVKLLISSETSQGGDVLFIPIIGIGGLGKTTLAQLVYNDDRVVKHFDMKLWVFVSDDFDVKAIIRKVIGSATLALCDLQEMDVLQSKLWGLLHKKRYLLVLDDVWNEDQDEWDKLRPLFTGGVDGSKIILTTHSKKVALSIDALTSPYYLKDLPDEDCFMLFNQRAFQRGEEKEHPNLIPIGMQIVKKCGGVPLAAKTLGGLMRFKREEREWLYVQNSELWNLDVGQSGILPALRLSYFHLPSHLKHCFSYCSTVLYFLKIMKSRRKS